MKNKMFLFKLICFIAIIFTCNFTTAQDACKVLMPSISGSYKGGCKKNLAHGKGEAKGTDTYTGKFIRGLPDGKGTYTWANGTEYIGEWSSGNREGKGTMIYHLAKGDSIINGYWKNNKYNGEKFIPPYKVNRKSNVLRSSIKKTGREIKGVRISILKGGMRNPYVSDMVLTKSSGEEDYSGGKLGIQNPQFPLSVKLNYTTKNQVGTTSIEVVFEFTIYDPGLWNVIISN
ncbi:MAG: hypothetical protein L3J11_03480 [Draconibacterium sp.]|nr:hypothetical protein [Draconibacterium sp.]